MRLPSFGRKVADLFLHHISMGLIERYKVLFKEKGFITSALLGLALLGLSTQLNYLASTYAFSVMSNGVNDIILDRIRVYDVRLIFVDGAILVAIIAFTLNILRPHFFAFTTKTVALLYFFRAIAITLTHLGPPLSVENMYLGGNITERFLFGADYFFSGHTSLPFILAMIFWNNHIARYFFLCCMIIFGITALMGHIHYTIDVYAAPFIAHSVYVMSTKLFRKDYERSQSM